MLRREKRGEIAPETCMLQSSRQELRFTTRDLLRVVGEAWRALLHDDEQESPERLLKSCRQIGWLSYRGDPETKRLVRCDGETWMQGRSEELVERSHRHPNS